MEMEESKEKVELVQQAIQRLMEQQRGKKPRSDGDGDGDGNGDGHRLPLLRRLLSELETLEGDGKIRTAPADQDDSPHSPALSGGETERQAANKEGGKNEEIVKELEKIKRQNFVTHCLLSALIALTVVWQLSEVSLVLRLKDGLNHPFRSLCGMLAGLLKRPIENAQNGHKETESSDKQQQLSLRIPEMTHLELPLGSDKGD